MHNKVLVSIISITWLLICMPTVTTTEDVDINADVNLDSDENLDVDVYADPENLDIDASVDEYENVDSDENINSGVNIDSNDNMQTYENIDSGANIQRYENADSGENIQTYENRDENLEARISPFNEPMQSNSNPRFVRKLPEVNGEDNLQAASNPTYVEVDNLESLNDFHDYDESLYMKDEEEDWTAPLLETNYRKDIIDDISEDIENRSPPSEYSSDMENLPPVPNYSSDPENLPPPPNYSSDPENLPPPPNYSSDPENLPPPPNYSSGPENLPPAFNYPLNNMNNEPPHLILVPINENNAPSPNDGNYPHFANVPLKIQIIPISLNPNFRLRKSLEDGPRPEDEIEEFEEENHEDHQQEGSNPSYSMVNNLQSVEDYHVYQQGHNSPNLQNIQNWNFPIFAQGYRKHEPGDVTPIFRNNQPPPQDSIPNPPPANPPPENPPPNNPPPSNTPQPEGTPPPPNSPPESGTGNQNGKISPENIPNLPPIDHKPVKTPLSIFAKIKQMEGCEPLPCPVNFDPVCAANDEVMTVYKNECDYKQTKRINPLREYTPISKECCLVFVKYGTVPQLNV